MQDRTKPFGGFSIIFVGDFCQLQPSNVSDDMLLYSKQSSCLFEHCLNCIIILDNDHRFKDNPELGKILKQFWLKDLSKKDRETINKRVIGKNGVELPKHVSSDACYACPTNAERNSIWANNFRKHVVETHPSVQSVENPPDNAVVIESDIKSSSSKRRTIKIDNVWRHRILTTCGDADVRCGMKCIDPALCLYIGAYLICIIKMTS